MPSITQYSRIFICPLFCKPMIYPSHSSGSLVLQAKYRRNCILNPIALSTDQLCYFKPTDSFRYLGLSCARLVVDVGLRIARVKWRRNRIQPVSDSVSSIIPVHSVKYRIGIQQVYQPPQTSGRPLGSMGNLFSKQRRIVDIPDLFSSACRLFWCEESPTGFSPKGRGERVGLRFKLLVHSIQRASQYFLCQFSIRPPRVRPFFINWITDSAVKTRNALALLFVLSPFLQTHDFVN